MILLECKNLTKQYGFHTALSHVSLQVGSGHIVGLLGPNGSGKTTLLKLIAGLLAPTAGMAYVMGEPIGIGSKRLVSYLPDHPCLGGHMRVQEAIHFFEDFYVDFSADCAHDMLDKLDIDPCCRIKSLSKGTAEKVQLILTMSRQASLYLLDEPIAGVDPAARDYILRTIISNYNENASILISTHLISDIENILDEVIFLQNGMVHTHASVDDLRQKEHKSIDAIFREVFKC